MNYAFFCKFLLLYNVVSSETTTNGHYGTGETTVRYELYTEQTSIPALELSGLNPPRNLTVFDIDDKTVSLRWLQPENRSDDVGYKIYITYDNRTNSFTYKPLPSSRIINYNLTKLRPNTEYMIQVRSSSSSGYQSIFATPIIIKTDVSGPSPPKFKNVSCDLNSTIVVSFERPTFFNGGIDSYTARILKDGVLYREISFSTTKEHLDIIYPFQNLTPNTFYDVVVYGSTRSNRTGRLIDGEKSKYRGVYVSKTCKIPNIPTRELWAGILIGLACAVIVLFFAGGSYYAWRKYIRAPYCYLDNTQCTPASLDWNSRPEKEYDEYSGPVPVSLFAEHVQQLHADGDIGFSKEYEAIQNCHDGKSNTSENSQHPDNKPKNRYLNIIAYDHSRVHLLPIPGQKISSYINANYIDGFQVNKAYIATQGPLPSTFESFWRMIWEQRVTIIVMITNLVERGRRKCDMYWPKTVEDYGIIQVKLIQEDIMATHTVRTLLLRHLRVKNKKDSSSAEKIVYQYHYTNWPDHGTPDHPLPVISFVKKSSEANPSESGPIVVHCSAGVGRTGTYIVLDAMLKQIKTRGEVNIYGFLKHIRSQRNFLVQTEEQYIFIHDALVEAIECGETNIEKEQFTKYLSFLHKIETPDKTILWKPLLVQYEQIVSYKPKDYNLISANKKCNQEKNRCNELVPIESSRVHLTPKAGEDGSDYINATWLPGFHSLREFIITQHPLESTRRDFWKMCWDHAVQIVVVLSEADDAEFKKFWPENEDTVECDMFVCHPANSDNNSRFQISEFIMKSVQDDFEVTTKLVYYPNWPHSGVRNIKEMYDLPSFCGESYKPTAGPICVVDRLGGTDAASLCVLLTIYKHMSYERKIDIYMYAKLYYMRRPGIFANLEDYMKLHYCVNMLCVPLDPNYEQVAPDIYTAMNMMRYKLSVDSKVGNNSVDLPANKDKRNSLDKEVIANNIVEIQSETIETSEDVIPTELSVLANSN